MQTITLQVDDISKLNNDKFDYLSSKNLDKLKKLSEEYKMGKVENFNEYKL